MTGFRHLLPGPIPVRAVLAGHSLLGLIFAGLLYLICFSGTLSVLDQSWQRWESPAVPVHQVDDAALARATRVMWPKGRAATQMTLTLPDAQLPRFIVRLKEDGHTRAVAFDASGCRAGAQATPWRDFLVHLHGYLCLPKTLGEILVGLSGVVLLSLLMSGVLAHPRIFRDAFHLRLGGARRVQESDLHIRIGVWGLPFHLIVSLTGALLGLSTLILSLLALAVFHGDLGKAYGLIYPPSLPHNAHQAEMPDLPPMLARVRTLAEPGETLRMVIIRHPGRADQSVLVATKRVKSLSRAETYLFDGAGKLLQKPAARASVGHKIMQTLEPLHFGWFGGWPVRIGYVLLGAGLCIVCGCGVTTWLARRRGQGRAVPWAERIWSALLWSQPIGFAASAMAALWGISPGPVWLAVTGFCLLMPLCVSDAGRVGHAGRITAAFLLLALALVHVLHFGFLCADPVAWIMDGALLLLAALTAFCRLPVLHCHAAAANPHFRGTLLM